MIQSDLETELTMDAAVSDCSKVKKLDPASVEEGQKGREWRVFA